jgi:DNA-binding IclR family transcriptional regulator
LSEVESKSSIQVIDRMMSLLNILATHVEPIGLKQLAAQTALHPSSAHRILGVMVEKGLAERVDHGNYQLGIKWLELGNLVKARLNVRQVALPFMQKLCDELGETVNLTLRQGDEIVYVERVAADTAMMRVVQVVGARAPLHITAVGKIFLSQDGNAACAAYAKRAGLRAYTENTITSAAKLKKQVEQAERDGFALDEEEAERGVCCIGAGIRDSNGRIIAGLSLSAPADRIKFAWADRVKQCAQEISRTLGYRG